MPEMYERIEQLCKERKTNITRMCKECGIPRASLSDYKSGRIQSLSAKVLAKIADYFGVSVDFLYGGSKMPYEKELKVALFGGDLFASISANDVFHQNGEGASVASDMVGIEIEIVLFVLINPRLKERAFG